jgi:hypothetical protein
MDYLDHQDKEDEMGRAFSTRGERRNACRIFVRKSRNKETTRRRWEDNIKIDLREIG